MWETYIASETITFYQCLNIAYKLPNIMPAKFEIYKDKSGGYRFRLKAANNEVIAQGESYKAKTSCMKGIESVKRNAPKAKVEDLTEK